jgi:hypothetical protein
LHDQSSNPSVLTAGKDFLGVGPIDRMQPARINHHLSWLRNLPMTEYCASVYITRDAHTPLTSASYSDLKQILLGFNIIQFSSIQSSNWARHRADHLRPSQSLCAQTDLESNQANQVQSWLSSVNPTPPSKSLAVQRVSTP